MQNRHQQELRYFPQDWDCQTGFSQPNGTLSHLYCPNTASADTLKQLLSGQPWHHPQHPEFDMTHSSAYRRQIRLEALGQVWVIGVRELPMPVTKRREAQPFMKYRGGEGRHTVNSSIQEAETGKFLGLQGQASLQNRTAKAP